MREAGGWSLDGAPQHAVDHATKCGGHETFWAYADGLAVGKISATFKGVGNGTLDFGNCNHYGHAKAYLNNLEIGSAAQKQDSVVITFTYKENDTLQVTAVGNGIIKINSLHLEVCDREGKIASKYLKHHIFLNTIIHPHIP